MPEFSGIEYDTALAACRPVRPEDYPPTLKQAWDQMVIENHEPFIYPGSTIGTCAYCDIEVYIGPRIQQVMNEQKVTILCLIHGALLAGQNAVSLGNDFKPQGYTPKEDK